MVDHTLSVSKLGEFYYASCSCGWKAKGRFTETMARREAEEHLLDPTVPSSLLEAHRNGKMEWQGTTAVTEDGGLLSSTVNRIRNGGGPRFQFGELIGLARRASSSGKPSEESPKPEVTHQTEREWTRYQCFMLGTQLGDTIEDLQEQTEDLVEQAAQATRKPDSVPLIPTASLSNLAHDLQDYLEVAEGYCGLGDEVTDGLYREVSHQITDGKLRTLDDVMALRRQLDQLTARVAYLGNTS